MKTTTLKALWVVWFVDGVTGETRTNQLRARTAELAERAHMRATGDRFGDRVVAVEAV